MFISDQGDRKTNHQAAGIVETDHPVRIRLHGAPEGHPEVTYLVCSC